MPFPVSEQSTGRDPHRAWALVLDQLRGRVDQSVIELWIAPLHPIECTAEALLLAGEPHLVQWARERASGLLDQIVSETGVASRVAWVDASPHQLQAPPPTLHGNHIAAASHGDGQPAAPAGEAIDASLRFETFVIGHSNRLAHGAALQVAELPASSFNPLLLCGPPGTGKTHLLHAIANYVSDTAPGLRVHLCTSEQFMNDFLGALRSKRTADFKSALRGVDVLLVDDIQFIAGKEATEEEFFHTFNALERSGAQLVLTSDQPPLALGSLSERLRARFASGLTVELERPDDALRRTYVNRRAAEELETPHERIQLSYLADQVTDGIRTLEGAILSTLAFQRVTGRELDQSLVDDVVRRLYPQKKRGPERPTIRRIQDIVCAAFDIDHDTLVGRSRALAVSHPRQLAMYLARHHTEASLPTIARAFGRSDHSTVIHAIKRITEQLEQDQTLHKQLAGLVEQLR